MRGYFKCAKCLQPFTPTIPTDSMCPACNSFAAGFGGWVDAKKSLPKEDGHYIVHAPSADPDKPLVAMAWYNPELGWSLLQECWCKAITHWMQKPKPPNAGTQRPGDAEARG